MHIRRVVFTVVVAGLFAGSAHAVKPPIVDAEADDTNAARDSYETARRANPYDSQFNSAAARIDAYNNFQSELAKLGQSANASSQMHAELWQPIGPAPIALGQTPTNSPIRSPVA